MQIAEEARSAFPRECCGLIEGTLTLSLVPAINRGKGEVMALHPARNLAGARDRFEIDPAAHFALLHKLRGSTRAIIGCYHSHPNGRPGPSEHDRQNADESGFLWLIAALAAPDAEPLIAASVSTGRAFAPVQIETC